VGTPANGLNYEHDILGSFSASAALCYLLLAREPNPLFSRRWALVGFWLSLGAMMVSLSRSAWIAFGVGFIIMIVFLRRRVRRPSRMAAVGIGVVAVGVLAAGAFGLVASGGAGSLGNTAVATQGSQLFAFNSRSGQARTSEWRIALSQVHNSPIIGQGTNSYGQRNAAPKKNNENSLGVETGSKTNTAYLGNLFIRSLYDSGAVGLGLILLFLAGVLWPRRSLRVSRGDLAPVAWAFIGGYVVLGVAFTATDASFQVWPWLLLGLISAATTLALRQYRTSRQPSRPVAVEANGRGPGPGPLPARSNRPG
jgi:hypothetical protein